MTSFPRSSIAVTELPSILKDRLSDHTINILDDEEMKSILPLCVNKRYHIVIEGESIIEYSVTVNEYSESPEIVRITKTR